MNQVAMTLWQAIELLTVQVPFSRAGVERALATSLAEASAEGGEEFRFLQGGAVRLNDGVEVSHIDLRLPRQGPHPGFLVLTLQGRCVSLAEVQQRYDNLQLSGVPRGHSLDEATSYSAALGWGGLSFGFTERNPSCLGHVVLDPR